MVQKGHPKCFQKAVVQAWGQSTTLVFSTQEMTKKQQLLLTLTGEAERGA